MSELIKRRELSPSSSEAIARLESLGNELEKSFPPADIRTEHHIHAGVYSRTIYVPAGVAVVGLTVKVPTQLIACGHFRLTDGDKTVEICGLHVLDGAAGRRAAVYAISDSAFTMLFATDAKTVEEAENEFTEEPERLLTRKEKRLCQVDG